MITQHILLLENEPIIRADVQSSLEANGYHVLPTDEVQEAISLCQEYMPTLALINFNPKDPTDGMAIAQILRGLCPITILFITTASLQEMSASKDYTQPYHILYMPFTRQQLLSAVQNLYNLV